MNAILHGTDSGLILQQLNKQVQLDTNLSRPRLKQTFTLNVRTSDRNFHRATSLNILGDPALVSDEVTSDDMTRHRAYAY